MSWDIMRSLSWENSVTNLPLGNVIIVGNLSKLEDRENWDPCCCNARVFLSLLDLWAARMVRTLHSSSAKDIIQERFVELSLSAIHLYTSSIYFGFISSEFMIRSFLLLAAKGVEPVEIAENQKSSKSTIFHGEYEGFHHPFSGGHQKCTQNSSLLPQVNTNLFNLIAWITESNWLDTTFQVEFLKYWISDILIFLRKVLASN